ncbi:MAG: hypothetical protein ABID63_10020 [Pseudomonadota bacterium]
MQEQIALDMFRLRQSRDDWDCQMQGHCAQHKTQIGNLPVEVIEAWDNMDRTWQEVEKDAGPDGETVSESVARKYHDASARLKDAWRKITPD